MPYQKGWKVCYACTGLWLCPDTKNFGGACVGPAGEHDAMGAPMFFELYYFGPETVRNYSGIEQDNWRCCKKCFVLFFDGNKSAGVCPAGGEHDSSGSKNYILEHQRYLFTDDRHRLLINWRWCKKCRQLCQPDWLVSRDFMCPSAPNATHDTQGSGFYCVRQDQWI